MALNFVMLTPSCELLPLPGEKVFMTVDKVDITLKSLVATSTQPIFKSSGHLHVSNKRLAFIASNAASLPNPTATELRTLSCPLSNFMDGRFVQPWLAANYYEANIKPVAGGGLSSMQLIKIDFKEGRGFDFTTTVEEVKSRFVEQHSQEGETLPPYQAESSNPISNPLPTLVATSYFPPPRTGRTTSMPSEDDLTAAAAARDGEAQECERDETRNAQPPNYAA